jgi:hypothetical protein
MAKLMDTAERTEVGEPNNDAETDATGIPLQSEVCPPQPAPPSRTAAWVRSGAVAVGAALAGGLLAAWWYRNTLNQLRQADADSKNPQFGIPAEPPSDEA